MRNFTINSEELDIFKKRLFDFFIKKEDRLSE